MLLLLSSLSLGGELFLAGRFPLGSEQGWFGPLFNWIVELPEFFQVYFG